jgi:hypothetical protein
MDHHLCFGVEQCHLHDPPLTILRLPRLEGLLCLDDLLS